MKAIIVYYSQTGNTKSIAKAIYSGMRQEGLVKCDIARLKDIAPGQDLKDYDLIGLGSPVIDGREIRNLTNFISSMGLVDGKHAFTFCTHGARPGQYMAGVVPAMIQKGLIVIGWQDWFGSVVHPLTPKPYFTDGHPDEVDLKDAEEFGKKMVERSRKIYAGKVGHIPTLPKGKQYQDIYDPVIPPLDKISHFLRLKARVELKFNMDKCRYPKCTHCAENCPMGSIDLSASPPVNRNCTLCLLCEQTCPQGAIEIDWPPLEKAHDALIPPLVEALEVFESRGNFRRLVPMENIGWATPLYRLKKPRFKVDG